MTKASSQRGFSLPELLIALALGAVVMTIMFKTFLGSQRATQRVSELIENRQNARTALQLLERDLRMAGSGWGRAIVEGCYNGAPISLEPIEVGYGGSVASNDSISVIGAFDAVTTLTTSMTLANKPTLIASIAGFSDDDFFVVTNGTNAHMFQVTSVMKSPNELVHGNSSLFNGTGGHLNWPSGGYAVGSLVYRASYITYHVDSTASKRLKLVRREVGKGDQLVAYDVTSFKVSYQLMDESVRRAPDDTATIERIVPVIATRVTIPGRAPLADSATTTIRPRSF